jgi:light-regulated signal transduction histidine kinase (bacteriophytochrome)
MRQTIDQIHPPASQAISLGYFEALAADVAAGLPARSLLTELEYFHADGGTVWCEVRVIPRVGPDGGVYEIIGLSRDISERKRREVDERRFADELERRVRERTAELQVANEELRSFSYSVSHDLRAPVRAVAGFARILERDYGDRLDAEGLHKLDNIITAGHTMGRLIDDLLAYTRVGQGSLSLMPVPLGPVLDGLRVALAARLAETGATLESVEPLATPVGDRSLIDRILLNLVDNAITYDRPGVPPHIRLSAVAAADGVTIAVADNGRGIPQDAWERVFEVFTRLTTDDAETRSGIGLATVRRAARAMGSEVTLESTVDTGTTFRLRLPAAPVG